MPKIFSHFIHTHIAQKKVFLSCLKCVVMTEKYSLKTLIHGFTQVCNYYSERHGLQCKNVWKTENHRLYFTKFLLHYTSVLIVKNSSDGILAEFWKQPKWQKKSNQDFDQNWVFLPVINRMFRNNLEPFTFLHTVLYYILDIKRMKCTFSTETNS